MKTPTKENGFNKDGSLSVYSLCCGFVQRDNKDGLVTLWKSGGVYHVQRREIKKSFDKLSEARTFYKSLIQATWNDLIDSVFYRK